MSRKMQSVSEALRKAILDCGENTMELERSTNVSNAILSRFLRRERGLALSTADKLASHLGLELVKRRRTKP